MSERAEQWAAAHPVRRVRYSRSNALRQSIYGCCAGLADDSTGLFHGHTRLIAFRTGMEPHQFEEVARCLRELAQRGLIEQHGTCIECGAHVYRFLYAKEMKS
ncbi:hypothetical protein [Paraburkholderia sp. BR10882]|uniref:hypothetical protein n=1 Tax=unclassified Paraburkholderia TaxID=2615204 RepID=UPI0034CEEAEE